MQVGNNAKILYARGSNLDEDSLFEERAGMFGKSLEEIAGPLHEIIAGSIEYCQPIRCHCCGCGRICRNEWRSRPAAAILKSLIFKKIY